VTVRRVVTGHDADGRSVFLSDGPAPQFHDRQMFVEIWNTAGAPASITAGERREPNLRALQLSPPENGTIIRTVDMPPGHRSAMHRTETIDYGIVLQGQVYLVLEDSETLLQPGDIVVQRGTNHAWDNRSDTPARMVFVLIHAEFEPVLRAQLRDMVLVP
jgi:quercetin dioxygenase-like cupin family protein